MRMLPVLVFATLAPACDSKDPSPAPSSAAPAVPGATELAAMTDYMRKSKATEAKANLGAIARGVASAAEEMSVGPDGTVQPTKLVSVGPTPAVGECCKQGGKCAPDRAHWDVPGWKQLFFQLENPHYYSYELVIEPGGFIARAIGDLDCDGELATFELRGVARPDGTYEVGGAPTSENPLE